MKGRFTVSAMLLMASAMVLPPRHIAKAATKQPKTIQIDARRFSFDPTEVTLKQDVPVTIALHALDATHGLRVTQLGVELKAGKGDTAVQTITPSTLGEFVGHCSNFCGAGHGGMAITFHVVP